MCVCVCVAVLASGGRMEFKKNFGFHKRIMIPNGTPKLCNLSGSFYKFTLTKCYK